MTIEFDCAKFWREQAEALDRNWSALHDATMTPIRAALGLPDGTVPELLARIAELKADAAKNGG